MEDDISWTQKPGSQSSNGSHRDYQSNLFRAKSFCKNIEKSLVQGMRVEITGSPELPESLLVISFSPPRTAKMGNHAAPIFLHQNSSEISKQIEAIINSYMKMAQVFWNRQPLIETKELPHAVGQ